MRAGDRFILGPLRPFLSLAPCPQSIANPNSCLGRVAARARMTRKGPMSRLSRCLAGIDVSKAMEIVGVHAVFTADDVKAAAEALTTATEA